MLLLLALACGPAPDSGADSAVARSWPADSSSAGIAAFVAGGTWRSGPDWVAETDAPREEFLNFSPHERVRVWLNDVLIDSKRAGNGGYEGIPHLTGSMSIKQMHGDDDALLGTAVMLKLEGDDQEWAYWCDGPEDLCGARFASTPYHAVSYDAECAFCHGGNIYNTLGDGG